MKKEHIIAVKSIIDSILITDNTLSDYHRSKLDHSSILLQQLLENQKSLENSKDLISLVLKALSILFEFLKSPPD